MMAHVNIETIMEKSVKLKQAVKDSNISDIVELVEAGAPTDTEIGGVPILLYAAQRDLWDVVEELFILNADLDIKYEILNWALIHQLSQAGKDVQLTNYLPFIEDKNITEDSKGQNALMIAVDAQKLSTFQILMEHGVELRTMDKQGNNVLHYVARAGWIDILQEVAEKNINLFTSPNKSGETVLGIVNMVLSDFIDTSRQNVVVTKTELPMTQETEQVREDMEVETEAPAKKKLSKIKKIS